jgi:hypothetical protein
MFFGVNPGDVEGELVVSRHGAFAVVFGRLGHSHSAHRIGGNGLFAPRDVESAKHYLSDANKSLVELSGVPR